MFADALWVWSFNFWLTQLSWGMFFTRIPHLRRILEDTSSGSVSSLVYIYVKEVIYCTGIVEKEDQIYYKSVHTIYPSILSKWIILLCLINGYWTSRSFEKGFHSQETKKKKKKKPNRPRLCRSYHHEGSNVSDHPFSPDLAGWFLTL